MKKDTSWEKAADWYDELLQGKDTYQQKVILPGMLRMLEIKSGERVLDLACGQGFFSLAFANAGAEVVAADASAELIRRAKRHQNIMYHVAAANNLGFVKSGSIDAIAFIMAIQNIDDVHAVLKECARVLAPKGKMILVMNHPSFRVPKHSDWEFDEEQHVEHRRVDQYLSEAKVKIQTHPGDAPADYTISFHRPLQFYFKAFAKTGFAVTRLEEWISHRKSQKGPRAAAEDRARKEIPLFLALEAKKS